MDDATPKRGGWLGRVIVVLVVWVLLAAGAYYVLSIMIGGGAPNPAARDAAATPPAPAPPAVDWTPQRIAEAPAAFLEASIARARDLGATRQRRLEDLTRRQREVQSRADELTQSLGDVRNVHDRMERAYRNAEDENRWPVKMAGRSFDRAKAEAILRDTREYVESRQPLADDYAAALSKHEAAVAALRGEIQTLDRLRDRMQLDLERVLLDAGSVPASDLVKIETRLDELSGAADDADDAAAVSPMAETKSGESFLQ